MSAIYKNGIIYGGESSSEEYEEGLKQIGTWTDGRKIMRYCFNNISKRDGQEVLIIEDENISSILRTCVCIDRGNEIDLVPYVNYINILVFKTPLRSKTGVYAIGGGISGSMTGFIDYISD